MRKAAAKTFLKHDNSSSFVQSHLFEVCNLVLSVFAPQSAMQTTYCIVMTDLTILS